jgi:TM2 domain-containing membrane protein YozV
MADATSAFLALLALYALSAAGAVLFGWLFQYVICCFIDWRQYEKSRKI